MFNLQNHYVEDWSDYDEDLLSVDWDMVDQILEKKRIESGEFLKQALK